METLFGKVKEAISAAVRNDFFVLCVTIWFLIYLVLVFVRRRLFRPSSRPSPATIDQRDLNAYRIIDDVRGRVGQIATPDNFSTDELLDRTIEMMHRIAAQYEPVAPHPALRVTPEQVYHHLKKTMGLFEDQVLMAVPEYLSRRLTVEDYKRLYQTFDVHGKTIEGTGRVLNWAFNAVRFITYGPLAVTFNLLSRAIVGRSLTAFLELWIDSAGETAISLYSGRELGSRKAEVARDTVLAMVEAARADGRVGPEEQELILSHVVDEPDLDLRQKMELIRISLGKARAPARRMMQGYDCAAAERILDRVEEVLLADSFHPSVKLEHLRKVREELTATIPELRPRKDAQKKLEERAGIAATASPASGSDRCWELLLRKLLVRAWLVASPGVRPGTPLPEEASSVMQLERSDAEPVFRELLMLEPMAWSDPTQLASEMVSFPAASIQHALRRTALVLASFPPLTDLSRAFYRKLAEGLGEPERAQRILDQAIQERFDKLGVSRKTPPQLLLTVLGELASGDEVNGFEPLDMVQWNLAAAENCLYWLAFLRSGLVLYRIGRKDPGRIPNGIRLGDVAVGFTSRRLLADLLVLESREHGVMTVKSTQRLRRLFGEHLRPRWEALLRLEMRLGRDSGLDSRALGARLRQRAGQFFAPVFSAEDLASLQREYLDPRPLSEVLCRFRSAGERAGLIDRIHAHVVGLASDRGKGSRPVGPESEVPRRPPLSLGLDLFLEAAALLERVTESTSLLRRDILELQPGSFECDSRMPPGLLAAALEGLGQEERILGFVELVDAALAQEPGRTLALLLTTDQLALLLGKEGARQRIVLGERNQPQVAPAVRGRPRLAVRGPEVGGELLLESRPDNALEAARLIERIQTGHWPKEGAGTTGPGAR
ncbi:MAG: TerB family tellurite resistance protein [Candidatus Riflebacteria bacterium]|nr:TerB family tellurite resistance protein [Candidatus Riflebacteria bacterium]